MYFLQLFLERRIIPIFALEDLEVVSYAKEEDYANSSRSFGSDVDMAHFFTEGQTGAECDEGDCCSNGDSFPFARNSAPLFAPCSLPGLREMAL